MRTIISGFLILAFVSCTSLSAMETRRDLELSLKNQNKHLLAIKYKVKAPATARSVQFGLDTLKSHELYLRRSDSSSYVFIASDGSVTGEMQAKLTKTGELYIGLEGSALFVEEKALALNLSEWEVFWVAKTPSKPKTESVHHQPRRVTDGFMRTDLTKDSHWKVASGNWGLRKRGGGMAEDVKQEHDYNIQRAVNPFSVSGSQGLFVYDDGDWGNAHVEGRFYFGRPSSSHCPDYNNLPSGDMMMVVGDPTGFHIAWGWDAVDSCFTLRSRVGTGTWTNHWQWHDARPPLTNWVRIGLTVCAGAVAEAFLDGKSMHTLPLTTRVTGPFSVLAGAGEIEVDDLRGWSLPVPAQTGHPIFVQSRQFAQKSLKNKSDPDGFTQWARSTETFIKREEEIDEQWFRATILTRMPLMGDFLYESLPYHKDAGEIQPGLYEFQILRQDPTEPMDLKKLIVVKSLKFMRLEEGWMSNEFETMDEEEPQFTLRFRRRAEDNNRITVQIGREYVPITEPVVGPVHFAIVRRLPSGNHARFPKPWHHQLTCRNLVNEFFEEAPTDWSWIEGGYGMDSRWACQDQWNFMSCAGTGVPMMVSKRRFVGNQQHEFFSSLRAVMPWDIGDENFSYDPDADKAKGFRRLKANDAWYNRQDVNFSFCMDGKNPLSGYSVLYAANNNKETLLMRKGKVIAASRHRFSADPKFRFVHWIWLHFHIKKYGNRIHVQLGDEIIFDFADPEPIQGGHTAFWTVRNGTVLARVISIGQQIEWNPHALYVTNDVISTWKPLIRDTVRLTKQVAPFSTRVTNNLGAGFFAVRKEFTPPVDLVKTPILELPIRTSTFTKVGIHLRINDKSYLVPLADTPLARMKSLLTRQFEKGEQFRRDAWKVSELEEKHLLPHKSADGIVRINLLQVLQSKGLSVKPQPLTEITVGNTSNVDYLLAGNGANQAGAYYELGEPRFLSKEPRRKVDK